MVGYGPQYARAVLRPLAEQVAAAIGDDTAVRVLDGDCGELAAALRAAAWWRRVDVVQRFDDVAGSGVMFASLCTVGDDASMLLRVREPPRRNAVIVAAWDSASPPAHERALLEAMRAGGRDAAPLQRFFTSVEPLRDEGFTVTALADVARFDSVAHCWNALALERADTLQLGSLSREVLGALQDELARRLQPYSAADGTLRIPFTAGLLTF